MKTFLEFLEEKQFLTESPNLTQAVTGLNVIVFVSTKHASHAARIKFQNNYNQKTQKDEFLIMTIGDEPEVINPNNKTIKVKERDIKKIKKWVKRNKEVLLNFWENKYQSDKEFLSNLVKYETEEMVK